MPCARFHVPPWATGEDAVGKLSTERARELAFVDRKPLEDLVVLSGKTKQNMNANIFCCSEIKTDFFISVYPQRFHVRLVAVHMQSVSTGLDIDASVPAYRHGLQTGALQHLQERHVGELQNANTAEGKQHLKSSMKVFRKIEAIFRRFRQTTTAICRGFH